MWWNAFVLAVRAIRRNILRSALTTLGIVIGVAAVITMVTIGEGATRRVTEQIASMGSNMLTIFPGQHRGPGGPSASARPFDMDDVEAIENQIGYVTAVAPIATTDALVILGNESRSTMVTGATNSYFAVLNWGLTSGRLFSPGELRLGAPVCLIGATVRDELFGAQDPLNTSLRIGKISCTVIGVLEPKGQNTFGMDQDDAVVIPLRMHHRRISGNQDVQRIQVAVMPGAPAAVVQREIQSLMRERRRIGVGEADDFDVRDIQELATAMTETTKVLTALLGAVAAVSLLVGGIGIMNIMLVSVTERTREIGIRLAIGALEREVLLQFLVEAVVLSSFGGLIGIGLALTTSAGLTRILGIPYVVNPWIILIAFCFSAVVGVIFGFVPARTAARLNPIDALRRE